MSFNILRPSTWGSKEGFNLFRPSTWGFEYIWTKSDKNIFEKTWENIKQVFTLPSKEGRETISEEAKGILGQVRGIFTPSLIWLGIVLIITLIIIYSFRKVLKI